MTPLYHISITLARQANRYDPDEDAKDGRADFDADEVNAGGTRG